MWECKEGRGSGGPRGMEDQGIKSASHKAAVQLAAIQNGFRTPFCIAAPFDILGIIPGKVMEWL